MIADMEACKKLRPIVTELFLRERQRNILPVLVWQCYFKVSKTIRLNVTHYFIMKIPNKTELQQIALNRFCGIKFKGFMKRSEPFSFLVNDTALLLDNPLRFRKNLLLNVCWWKNQSNR